MFKHLFRKSVLTTAVAGVGMLALTAGPAFATPTAVVGVVDGGVGLSDGAGGGLGGGGATNPLICKHLTFNFVGVEIAGAAVEGTNAAVGTINAGTLSSPITGGSTGSLPLPAPLGCPAGQENLLSATGSINAFPITPNTSVVGTISGNCSGGTYTRVGGAVVVNLACTLSVNGAPANPITVVNVAWFQPDNPAENGITNSYTHATFAGLFAGAGV